MKRNDSAATRQPARGIILVCVFDADVLKAKNRTSIVSIPRSKSASASCTWGGGTGPNVCASAECCALSSPKGPRSDGRSRLYSAEESMVTLLIRHGRISILEAVLIVC